MKTMTKKIEDAIFSILRKRKYYRINDYDITREIPGTILIKKYIINHELFVRVERIKGFTKAFYENQIKPPCVNVCMVEFFDIHTVPANVIIELQNGAAVIKS